jgi:hypothetical protein
MPKAETHKTRRLIEVAAEILAEQSPMTVRQLFYRLVSIGLLENSQAHYAKVSRVMTIARKDGRIEYDLIVDRSRPTYSPSVWRDPGQYAKTIQHSYRKDYWETQPVHVEIWAEKDAVIGSIQDLTDELGITVRVGRGFQSTTRVHEIAEHFESIGKPIYVYYLGDHDPSGREIQDDLILRVRADFRLTRLAIHEEDIAKFKLPPLRVKTNDPRAASFLFRHGDECVELDALPPTELRRRIRKAVMRHVDTESWKRTKLVEAAETKSIVSFAKTLQNLEAIQ